METLQGPKPPELNSFDRELRRYDDTTTWLAEAVDGSMRTTFEYTFDGRELYSHDGGELGPVFDNSIKVAKHLGPSRAFELRRAYLEKDEYKLMLKMARGEAPNTMVVVSDIPPEVTNGLHSDNYNMERKPTMLRVITVGVDGRITMRSQSLDKSDRDGLEAAYGSLGLKPLPGELLGQRMHLNMEPMDQEFLIDALTGVYDRTLSTKYGVEHYAGRTGLDRRNTYEFVRAQTDLLGEFMNMSVGGIDRKVLYGLAAAMQNRYNNKQTSKHHSYKRNGGGYHGDALGYHARQEMLDAAEQAAANGDEFYACGDVLVGGGGKMSGPGGEMARMGYGPKIEKDKYGPLVFKCKKGCINKRPKNTIIPKCKSCGISVSCGPKQQKKHAPKKPAPNPNKQRLGAFLVKEKTK